MTAALLNINQFLWREDHEQATDRECHWLCLPYPGDGCRSPNLLRRSLESRLLYTTGKLRSDLQFLSEHKRRRCDASQSGEVQRGCRKIGRGSRVGDGPRQIRIRFGKVDARLRRRDLERPRRRWALLGILDRATKQLGRNHRDTRRRPRQGPGGSFRRACANGNARAYNGSRERAADLPRWVHHYNWRRPDGSVKSKPPVSRLGSTGTKYRGSTSNALRSSC
jgi:hypothetical protein